jgi:hypothetical protein
MSIPVTRLSELSTGAQLVMWSTRHLVLSAIRGAGVPWCVERSFEIAGAIAAYDELQRMIVEIARHTPRELTVARPSSGALTPDEVLLSSLLLAEEGVEVEVSASMFGENAGESAVRLREAMESSGLPLSRLGMPEARHLIAGRAPALHANPGMADLH